MRKLLAPFTGASKVTAAPYACQDNLLPSAKLNSKSGSSESRVRCEARGQTSKTQSNIVIDVER